MLLCTSIPALSIPAFSPSHLFLFFSSFFSPLFSLGAKCYTHQKTAHPGLPSQPSSPAGIVLERDAAGQGSITTFFVKFCFILFYPKVFKRERRAGGERAHQRHLAEDGVDQGRLAAADPAHDADQLALCHVQVYVRQPPRGIGRHSARRSHSTPGGRFTALQGTHGNVLARFVRELQTW